MKVLWYLRSEVVQFNASVVPLNLTRKLEAKIGIQNYEIRGVQKIYKPDSLNSWDEVNLNSIQGVCVDEGVATSISSVSRITESAISHPPQAGSDPEKFPKRENTMPKAASTLVAAPSAPLAWITKKLQWLHTILPYRRAVTVPGFGSPTKKETEAILIDKMASTKIIHKLQWRSLSFPTPECYGLVKLRILKALMSSLLQHPSQVDQ